MGVALGVAMVAIELVGVDSVGLSNNVLRVVGVVGLARGGVLGATLAGPSTLRTVVSTFHRAWQSVHHTSL